MYELILETGGYVSGSYSWMARVIQTLVNSVALRLWESSKLAVDTDRS